MTNGGENLPVYEYQCSCCASRFEVRKSFSEDGSASCPSCGGHAERVFSPVPIIFKGSGFYCTDSRGSQSYSLQDSGDTAKTGGKEES